MKVFSEDTHSKICYLFHYEDFSASNLLFMATAYLMLALVGPLEHVNSSPTAAARLSLYT